MAFVCLTCIVLLSTVLVGIVVVKAPVYSDVNRCLFSTVVRIAYCSLLVCKRSLLPELVAVSIWHCLLLLPLPVGVIRSYILLLRHCLVSDLVTSVYRFVCLRLRLSDSVAIGLLWNSIGGGWVCCLIVRVILCAPALVSWRSIESSFY